MNIFYLEYVVAGVALLLYAWQFIRTSKMEPDEKAGRELRKR